MSVAFAAAGTGGHVYPALAVAEALVARGRRRDSIVFFGGDRMEAEVVPGAGFDFVSAPLIGLRRSLSLANARIPFVVRKAAAVMEAVLRQREVRAVAVFGGYVTVPAALAARRAGVPVIVQEQNALPGLANRFAARRAARVFAAFPAAQARLRRAEIVGNPLRAGLVAFDRIERRPAARRRYDLPPEIPVLGVLGGSLGARILNEAAAAFVTTPAESDRAVLHLAGRAHADRVGSAAETSPVPWKVVAFEDRMEDFYAAVDLVLCRGGAVTVSELAATGTPAVIVPYAAARGGEQAANAAFLAERNAAIIVDETEVAGLPALLAGLLHDSIRRDHMGAAAAALGRPDAADHIAAAIEEAVRG